MTNEEKDACKVAMTVVNRATKRRFKLLWRGTKAIADAASRLRVTVKDKEVVN